MHTILAQGYHKSGGRNRGLISVPRRARLIKRNIRYIDYKRNVYPKTPISLLKDKIYDPNRSAKLSLVVNIAGQVHYNLSCDYAQKQKIIFNLKNPNNAKEKGYSNYLMYIPSGSLIYAIETIPGMGAKLIRSAGTSAILLKKEDNINGQALIKLKSGEHRLFRNNCIASMGVVGNQKHFLRDYKKAGITRLLGRRSRVRPSVMNPVDHPMGGRTKGGCAPRSKTGKLSQGPSTANKKSHNLILITARKSRKQRIS